MIRALVPQLSKNLAPILLHDDESHHLRSVLRIEEGEQIEVLDGRGYFVRAEILFQGKHLVAQPLSEPQSDALRLSSPLRLMIGILKGEAMEWVIEKATELGVRELFPLTTEFTVVHTHKKGASAFTDRWQKISNQALKQCGRLDQLLIHPPQTFEQAFTQQHLVLWADEGGNNSSTPQTVTSLQYSQALALKNDYETLSVLIGPEGGFSYSERSRLLQLAEATQTNKTQRLVRTSLGQVTLRAETAALGMISVLRFCR